MGKFQKQNPEEFLNKLKNIYGEKYDFSKTVYIDYNTKVTVICPEHGEFTQSPAQLMKGYACPKCRREKGAEKYYENRLCPICKKQFRVRKKYEKITCSENCYKIYVQIHKNEINEKRSNSLKKTFQKMSSEHKKEIQAKREKTFLEKYGTNKPNQLPEYKEKMSKLFSKKDWGERSENIKNKILIPKYSEICEKDNLTLIEFRNRFDCTVQCNICNTVFDTHVLGYLTENSTHNLCRTCHPIDYNLGESQISIEFENILIENKVSYYKNYRQLIKPLEVDFFIPDLNLAFEINGNYWHSEKLKDKNYHINKTKLCQEKGVKLIHIFEDELKLKYDITKSRVETLLKKSKHKIYARQCSIRDISVLEKKDFLNKNHLDGDTISKYNIGLFYDDILVSVATFGKRKISKKQEFELLRFTNRVGYLVIGGFSKLVSYFIKHYDFDELITYADIRWSGCDEKNTVYFKNGFEYISTSKPNYFYLKNNDFINRLNRCNFMKHKLVKMGYDKNKTESQIMNENGYTKIWDCGSLKYAYKKREIV